MLTLFSIDLFHRSFVLLYIFVLCIVHCACMDWCDVWRGDVIMLLSLFSQSSPCFILIETSGIVCMMFWCGSDSVHCIYPCLFSQSSPCFTLIVTTVVVHDVLVWQQLSSLYLSLFVLTEQPMFHTHCNQWHCVHDVLVWQQLSSLYLSLFVLTEQPMFHTHWNQWHCVHDVLVWRAAQFIVFILVCSHRAVHVSHSL